MSNAVAILLAIAVIVLSGGMVAAFAWARAETIQRVSAQEDKVLLEKKSNDLEDARDAAIAFQKAAELDRDKAVQRAAAFEESYTKARKELESHVREKLVTGTDADVAAEVDRLLG